MHVGSKAPNPWLCQPISEEPESVEFEELKRHHKHRPPRNRYLKCIFEKTVPYPFTSMSLMPRTDSFNARVRGTSHIDFKTATTGVAAKSMRNELSRLVSTVDDPGAKKVYFSPHMSLISNPPSSRLSIPKCSLFSTCSPVISQSVLKVWICTSPSSRSIPFQLTIIQWLGSYQISRWRPDYSICWPSKTSWYKKPQQVGRAQGQRWSRYFDGFVSHNSSPPIPSSHTPFV